MEDVKVINLVSETFVSVATASTDTARRTLLPA